MAHLKKKNGRYSPDVFLLPFGSRKDLANNVKAASSLLGANNKKTWYVGKANVLRDDGTVVQRFKEHVLSTFKPPEVGPSERRYQSWRGTPKCNFLWLPFCLGV